MTIGEPFGSLCICALTTAGRRPSGAVIESPSRAVSRAETLTPGLLAASALELNPATTDPGQVRRGATPPDPLPRQTRGENTDLHREH
jgi:hypothetical protein